MRNLLVTIIRETFLKEAGKFQEQQDKPKAFLVSFSLTIDYDKEEGYRQLDLLLYAPFNYVQVWQRERWTVIPLEQLEDGDDGDTYIKAGHDYDEGSSTWKLIGDHDSCWPDGVDSCLKEYAQRITTFDGLGDWYSIIEVPEGLEKV